MTRCVASSPTERRSTRSQVRRAGPGPSTVVKRQRAVVLHDKEVRVAVVVDAVADAPVEALADAQRDPVHQRDVHRLRRATMLASTGRRNGRTAPQDSGGAHRSRPRPCPRTAAEAPGPRGSAGTALFAASQSAQTNQRHRQRLTRGSSSDEELPSYEAQRQTQDARSRPRVVPVPGDRASQSTLLDNRAP